MSLINEALRKARKEAGEEDDGRLRINTCSHGSGRRGVGSALVLGAVIAVIAAIGGAGVVWWFLADRQPQNNMITSAITSDENPASLTSGEKPLPPQEGETDIEGALDSELRSHVIPIESPPEAEAPLPTSEVLGEPPSKLTPPAADKRDFLAEADLGTAQLSLDYIVFRSDDPYAEINGIEVHVGNHIEGFVVEEITRDLVRLSDENGPLLLRAR